MTVQNKKTKLKSKKAINNKRKPKRLTKKQKEEKIRKIRKINKETLLVITFFTGILLLVSTYAWLSASLNVRVKFFDLVVSSDNGLFISLDGIDFSDSIEISMDSVITDLKSRYPNHTNQWASGGLWPVSSNGIKNPNMDKFDIYVGEVVKRKGKNGKKFLHTRLMNENNSNGANVYMAFDMFLKNVSGSPFSDNLYFDDETLIAYEDDTPDDTKEHMDGVMNSMRIGIVKMASVSSKTAVNTIQNLKCNNSCQMVIYEPNSTSHSSESIEKVGELGINLVDGQYVPSYGVINEGNYLEHANGQTGTGIPLDTAHFALQQTITNFDRPIFQIPNGITKFRVYVWIEGQDVDSLETNSRGAAISIIVNLVKDLSGYN